MKAKRLSPTARFRKFVQDYPGMVDLPTAVAIEAALKDGKKLHWRLLEEVAELVRGRQTANPSELVRLIIFHDADSLYRWRDREEFLEQASRLIGGHGVEKVTDEDGEASLTYINMGDTYRTTLAWDGDKLIVTSWGGWVEWAENTRRPRLRF